MFPGTFDDDIFHDSSKLGEILVYRSMRE